MWSFRIEEYKKKAILEDFLVGALFDEYRRDLTMHGGTCIWRCYGGQRFSRDVDFYFKTTSIEQSCRYFLDFLKEKGLAVKESGYFNVRNTFSVIVQTDTKVKLDVNFDFKEGGEVDYSTVSGGKRMIIALSAESILNEKIEAYSDKFGKNSEEIQDLYDLWVLRNAVENPSTSTKLRLSGLLDLINGRKPKNNVVLETLMLGSVAPGFDRMISDLKVWVS
ncbi:MAG: nucleotidyl transferase AbiEii/AbiGii toxin family protein [Candidatus Marsarchaeota archaeon]|nr:nucleotidyl transferase AbiEii/AbiGii toxin family protein [Candidatus Marsarchaeota archaeon]